MMIPVRCFTCGKVVAGAYEPYQARVTEGEDAGEVLSDLGVQRYCCRRMVLSHVDLIDDASKYHV